MEHNIQKLNDSEIKEYRALMKGLERSKFEKALIMPLLDNNVDHILEIGCGNGVVLDLLSHNFPGSKITGVDIDPVMCAAARKKELSNVDILQSCAKEIELPDSSVQTVIYCSTIHEIFSHGGEKEVMHSLEEARRVLKSNGSLIIRDTVKPFPRKVTIGFKNNFVKTQFKKFVRDYRGVDVEASFMEQGSASLNIDVCFEFLTKYFYEVGWHKEMEEVYGYYTENEFSEILTELGFEISYKKTYLLPYFKERWAADITLDCPFPYSTIILKTHKV